jgi:hypothetical protein
VAEPHAGLSEIVRTAPRREYPTVAFTRRWHSLAMKNLTVPDPRFVGAFRGEPGLERVQARVGAEYGVDAAEVADALEHFERKLRALVADVDSMLPAGQEPDADRLAATVDLCLGSGRVGAHSSLCKPKWPDSVPVGQLPRHAVRPAAL